MAGGVSPGTCAVFAVRAGCGALGAGSVCPLRLAVCPKKGCVPGDRGEIIASGPSVGGGLCQLLVQPLCAVFVQCFLSGGSCVQAMCPLSRAVSPGTSGDVALGCVPVAVSPGEASLLTGGSSRPGHPSATVCDSCWCNHCVEYLYSAFYLRSVVCRRCVP